MLCRGIRKGISECIKDSEVKVRSARYGACQQKHAESFIKRHIKAWAIERNALESIYETGVSFSKAQIEAIVEEQFEEVLKGRAEVACQWANCREEY